MKQIIENYIQLRSGLPALLKKTGLKDTFIMQKIGMNKSNYYRRMKDTSVFTAEEIKHIIEVLQLE